MICFYFTLLDDENDIISFEKLYMETKGKLFSVSYNILKNDYQAEDAVSETFCKIAKKFRELKHLTSEQLRAYCIVTVRNISLNMIRDNSNEVCAYTDKIIYDDSFISNEALEYTDKIYLKEVIDKLEYDDYEILMLFYFYRYSLKEISELKNIRYSAAKKRIQRARDRLKKLMEDSYAENEL